MDKFEINNHRSTNNSSTILEILLKKETILEMANGYKIKIDHIDISSDRS